MEWIKIQQVKKTIEISESLYKSLKQFADDSGFESPDEFANFVLDEVIRRGAREENKLTDDERKEVDNNLKSWAIWMKKLTDDFG